jgi:ubiquinone/menaquinone biosynthesis C-methylase UbiE
MHLSERQQREIEYHRHRAREHQSDASQTISPAQFTSQRFRWWNAYWVISRKATAIGLANKRVLVIGSGFGDDAIFLNLFGATTVCAIDISEESIKIARQRSINSCATVSFYVSTAECLPFPDQIFDLVYIPDVMHHLDIQRAARDCRRVLKPGGLLLGNEPYTHSWIQKIRNTPLVRRFLYPRMVKYIYKTDTPYITTDERKLDERDFRIIHDTFNIIDKQYFLLLSGRLLPVGAQYAAIFDRIILKLPLVGYFLGGRVVFAARPFSETESVS